MTSQMKFKDQRNTLKQTGLFFIIMILSAGCTKTRQVWLDDLDIRAYAQDISTPVSLKAGGTDSVKIGKDYFTRGLSVRTVSVITFETGGNAKRFRAAAGVPDIPEVAGGVKFYVVGDRKVLFESDTLMPGDPPQDADVDIKGVHRLGLLAVNTSQEHSRIRACWANAEFLMTVDTVPQPVISRGEKYILTPEPAKTPRINSSGVFGATPGNPFLYTVAATGDRPVTFSAAHLPSGLSLDPETGIISGKVNRPGTYFADLKAKNDVGEADMKLRIVIGDTIALTPPMGWNGWNSWAKDIDRAKVISSADAMVSSGLIRHGWTYINIDDTWEGQRGGKFQGIQPNEKFPDFPQMVKYIHSLGLKAGLYSTPWIITYAGYTGCSSDFKDGYFPDSLRENKRAYRHVGKYTFEPNDAAQMAEWGIDYLKYDWHLTVPPAERMQKALRNSGRDIIYSLSNSASFNLAADWSRIANLWRTGGDIRDSWLSLYYSAFLIDKWAPYGGPGHWNDPDMLVVGNISTGLDLHPTRLTPDEQYSHISIYCLLSAPLLLGCPLEQLDPFTLNLLMNDEVLEIDQDPLGKPARLFSDEKGVQVWVKPMEDGSYAVGLFNTDQYGQTPSSYFCWGDETDKSFTFHTADAGLSGKWKARDTWRQKDLEENGGGWNLTIPYHGVVLLRMVPVK